MKNINKYLLVIFIFILSFTYISYINNTDNTNNLNPFDNIDDDSTAIASEYGHSPYNPPENYTYYYQGDVLNIPYTFYGGRVDSEVGLLIFIDGIVQQYSINDSNDTIYDSMKIFNINANSEETYTLNINPNCGKKGDILKLNFVCIDFPILNMLDESSIDLQTMSTTISWKLSYLEDSKVLKFPSKEGTRIKNISNTIENYNSDKSEFDSSLEKSNINFEAIKFIANSGKNDGLYKTTIFINNKPAIIDKDKNFIEYEINKDKKLIYKAEIDDSNVNNTIIIYAVSIRLDNTIDNWYSQIDVFKSNSILINTN